MSLDIWLTGEADEGPCTCPHCGNEHRSSRKETLYDANITHNLGPMANAAAPMPAFREPSTQSDSYPPERFGADQAGVAAEACMLCGGDFVEHLNLPRRGTCAVCGRTTCSACREDRGYRYDDEGTLMVTAAVCNACLPIYEAVRTRFAWDVKEDDAFWSHCRKVAGIRANDAPGQGSRNSAPNDSGA